MVQTISKNFLLRTPSFALVYTRTTVVIALVYVGECCSCVKYKLKHMLKVPVYPPTQTYFFVWNDCLRQNMLWTTSFRSELGTAPHNLASNSLLCAFATLKQEMWSWTFNKGPAMCRLPVCCNAQLWPHFHCLWLMWLLAEKNCLANQCCGVNEFDVFKSTWCLVLMFPNSFKT